MNEWLAHLCNPQLKSQQLHDLKGGHASINQKVLSVSRGAPLRENITWIGQPVTIENVLHFESFSFILHFNTH